MFSLHFVLWWWFLGRPGVGGAAGYPAAGRPGVPGGQADTGFGSGPGGPGFGGSPGGAGFGGAPGTPGFGSGTPGAPGFGGTSPGGFGGPSGTFWIILIIKISFAGLLVKKYLALSNLIAQCSHTVSLKIKFCTMQSWCFNVLSYSNRNCFF